MAAGGAGKSMTVWDLDAKDVAASKTESEFVDRLLSGVAFSPGGDWLAAGASDGKIHLWDWRSGGRGVRTIQGEGSATTLEWLDDSRLVSGGSSGRVSIWETDIDRLKKMARRVAGRELSVSERRRFAGE